MTKKNDNGDILNFLLEVFSRLRISKNVVKEFNKLDYYWDIIPNQELYNPYKKPENITLGQLDDDLIILHEKITNSIELDFMDIVRLGNILRGVGYATSQSMLK